jgi:ProQ/FINO family
MAVVKSATGVYVIPPTRGSGMAPTYRNERDRGCKEYPEQLAVLRERWPIAFPTEHEDVRPLAIGVARQVAAAMGWSLPYTLGVLTRWKMAAVYCQAVLSHDQRIGCDGAGGSVIASQSRHVNFSRTCSTIFQSPRFAFERLRHHLTELAQPDAAATIPARSPS